MQRQERFLAALHRETPDRVPMFDFLFQQPMYSALIGHAPEGYNAEDAVRCALALDHDGVWLPFGGFTGYQPVYLAENVYQDEWGTTFQKNTSSWPIDAPIAYPIQSRADLKKYVPPDPSLPGRTADIEAARGLDADGIALLGGVAGPLSTLWMLMGYEAICYALYEDPQMLVDITRISIDFAKEAARRSVEAGCVGIWISEDLGDSTRGFFRLPDYRKYLLPPFAELAEYIDSLGVPVLLHSCGHISAYLDDIAQTKVASVHPLQRTAGMHLAEFKARYGDRFCIIGNIDSSRTLPYGSPAEVEAEVKEAIDIAAPGGGYILGSDHSLHDGIPLENILTLFKTGAEYGKAFYQRMEHSK
jgi:uroporphyrinogen decarboxylase